MTVLGLGVFDFEVKMGPIMLCFNLAVSEIISIFFLFDFIFLPSGFRLGLALALR